MDLYQWLKRAYLGNRSPSVRVPDDSDAPLVRRRYRFSGGVQGVGFRYTAKLLAEELNLVGWVRNQNDGTVLLEIEGGAGRVDEFLRVVQEAPRFHIRGIDTEDLPLSGTETDFQVVY